MYKERSVGQRVDQLANNVGYNRARVAMKWSRHLFPHTVIKIHKAITFMCSHGSTEQFSYQTYDVILNIWKFVILKFLEGRRNCSGWLRMI